jgi:hypothetical protein
MPQRRRSTRKTTTTRATRRAIHTTTQIHSGPIVAPPLCLLSVHRRSSGMSTGQRPTDRLRQERSGSDGGGFVQRRRMRVGSGSVLIEPRLQEGRRQGLLLDWVRLGLGELDRPGPSQRARPTRQAGTRAATTAAVHHQPLDRIRRGVQSGLDGGQPIEALPLKLVSEGNLQDDPQRYSCQAQSTAPLVRAASTRASPWASFQRAAENRPLNTSMDHHSIAVTVIPPNPPD